MIKPGTPVPMWAIHDRTLDTFSFPQPTHEETRLGRDRQLAGMEPPARARLFPVVPVDVFITPRHSAPEAAQQPALFSEADA